ncbi:hypothetical protein TNCV_929891 [Trichonephila clavipes]|nr:hypothetical protein TNCV_929891 [Trichonephila clavipes]
MKHSLQHCGTRGLRNLLYQRRSIADISCIDRAKKTSDRVVTAQRALCCHLGRVEFQIQIRDFQKNRECHILNSMQYQSIPGIDFMMDSKLTLDSDKKSLIDLDDEIKQWPKVEKPVEIDLSNTKLGEGQKLKLKNVFNILRGYFQTSLG